MCYLDIYSKKSFDMYEDVLMYIHPSRTYAWSFCCIACGFFFFFKGANKHFLSGFFSLPIVFFFNPLAARSVPAVLSATEVEAARGVF